MLGDDPIAAFQRLHADAGRGMPDAVANAVTIATVGADGRPSARVVLVRNVDSRGFVFFTNFHSRKGMELLANPAISLCFHWPATGIQVRVEGLATPVSDAEADAYFATRARPSQIAASVSPQSQPIRFRFELLRRFVRLARSLGAQPVPRPPHWSGFRVAPDVIEFWFDRPHRLHERHVFTRDGVGWRRSLLAP